MTDLQPKLLVKLLHEKAKLPTLGTPGAAGVDVHAFLTDHSGRATKLLCPARAVRVIPTGIAVQPPPGHVTMVCSRGGLTRETCMFVANSPGIVDGDYTGELFILMYNGGFEAHYIQHEQRIAQLVTLPLSLVGVQQVSGFSATSRGEGAFGSTGI